MKFLLFVFVLVTLLVNVDSNRLECLKRPPSQYVKTLKNVEGMVQDIISLLHELHNNVDCFEEFRVSNAIETCFKLLDMSIEELGWCVSAIQSPYQGNGTGTGTGNLSSDLRIWLSAIQTDLDTCIEQFEGTNTRTIKDKIFPKINKINSLVYDLYTKVEIQKEEYSLKSGQFSSWINRNDQQLLKRKEKDIVFDVVVTKDGSGNFTKVVDAVNAAPSSSTKLFIIQIKRGVYYENVEVAKKNIVMIGQGMDRTFISSNLSNATSNLSTYDTATFGVTGSGFIARDISFRNTAGPKGFQAVALRSSSDMSVCYRCGIYGYQDSLYAFSNRQFYRECQIKGTIDFIFGSAVAVFQNCTILVRKGLPNQSNPITAQGGKLNGNPTAFSFQFCNISADFDLLPSIKVISTFLGRPWKPYSTTIFMESYIGNLLSPKGWVSWKGSENLDTLFYAEYKNFGPGANTRNRVKWQRYHVLNYPRQAINFTVSRLISGNVWLPSTGVPFTPGL